MTRNKLLALSIIGIGLLSSKSYTAEQHAQQKTFPVTVTANVTAPAPEVQLLVNNKEVNSIDFNFGDVEVGKTVAPKTATLTLNVRNQAGNGWAPSESWEATLENTTLSSNIGKATLTMNTYRGCPQSITTNFVPLSPGVFTEKTNFTISVFN